ncbi:sex peptide receptor [Tribolium castaneum]|uniref:Myosuppressin-like G protein-coupled receptor n=1 Tax=Tribolium castaneum TaxID=7070 RepID=N1NTU4_TRICA|nr:sex peptide receptor [Tribolium castaneum]DAA64475.1 TPA_inf: myosuppressin-like G protein-coupled receptor [Tribolium castaneum]
MNVTSQNVTYCDLMSVKKTFSVYHNYLSVIICIFGSVTNVLNICVLTTKPMRCPTNMILTGLALANLLVILDYLPFVFLYNGDKAYAFHFTYNLAVFVIFHAWFAQSFHFISCCLTVVLAIWQYIAIKFPQNNSKWCSNKVTKITILLTYILCPVICIPLNVSLKIWEKQVPVDENEKIQKTAKTGTHNATIYVTDYESEYSQYISSSVYAIAMKLVPCILLTVLSSLLIVEILKAKERRKKLMTPKPDETAAMRKPSQRCLEKVKQADRTTMMLLAVLLLFLLVEFPQAIFGLLNVVIGKTFEVECYQKLVIHDSFAISETNGVNNFSITLSVNMSKMFTEEHEKNMLESVMDVGLTYTLSSEIVKID